MSGSLDVVAPSGPLDEDALMRLAAEMVLALRWSIPHGVIPPLAHWDRIKSALVTAAQRAETYRELVSLAAKKLQIEAPQKRSGKWISSIGAAVREPEIWEAFRRLVERNACFVVVEAQILADEGLADERVEELKALARKKAETYLSREGLAPYSPPDDAELDARLLLAEQFIRESAIHHGRILNRIAELEADNAALLASIKEA